MIWYFEFEIILIEMQLSHDVKKSMSSKKMYVITIFFLSNHFSYFVFIVYKKIMKSNLGDNFYIRTHFDHESNHPIGLTFTRGEVFRVIDTMHKGKLGNWLAIRMGNDLHEMDKGIIPNQERYRRRAFYSLSF